MKAIKIKIFAAAVFALAAFAATGCKTIGAVFGNPSISLAGVSIKSLDLEGITFNVDYEISNPYPLACSIKGLNANVLYETTKLTSLSADAGVKIASMGKAKNALSFKIPYNTVINFATGKAATKNKKSLPFAVDGNVSLDLSAISFLENKSLTLPFKKDFEVPVFKPSLSVSNPAIKLPSVTELRDSFVNGGMGVTKALSVATAIVSGGNVADTVFDGVNMNFDFTFNLDVKNEGNAPWKYKLQSCALKTQNLSLANLSVSGNDTITSNGSVPIKTTLNTVQAGKFIVQLLNKKGTNPQFSLNSALTFTDLPSYAQNLPLNYSKEIALSSVKTTK